MRSYIESSTVTAAQGHDLTVDALSNNRINAIVVAGSAAVAASGNNAVGFSGAGAYAENRIANAVQAISAKGAGLAGNQFTGDNVFFTAKDKSTINVVNLVTFSFTNINFIMNRQSNSFFWDSFK